VRARSSGSCRSRSSSLQEFSGHPGKYVPVKQSVEGLQGIIEGKYDDLSESAFYMIGHDRPRPLKKQKLLAGTLTMSETKTFLLEIVSPERKSIQR